jgi:hypothetical protein
MAVYWTIAILTVLINLYPVKNQKDYSVRLIISLLPLFLYGAFRINYGLDYEGYEDFFNVAKVFGIESNERMELGYYYLNKILPSFRSLLIVQTLLICTAYFYLFKWYIPEKWAWLGFVLLFLAGPITIFFMLSGIRNGIAISLFIISTYFIFKRKFIPFAVLIFIAYWFHNSVLLYAPIAYFAANDKAITKKSIVIWLSVMVVLTAASFTVILDYVEIFINTYFERYTSYIKFAHEQGKGAGVLVSIFSFVAVILLFLNVRYMKQPVNSSHKKSVKKNSRNVKYMGLSANDIQKYKTILLSITKKETILLAKDNMMIKMTLLFFLSFLLGPLNMRMSHYFAAFFVVSSILVMDRSSNIVLKYAYITLIFAYLIYALILWFGNPYFSYTTYQSVFF